MENKIISKSWMIRHIIISFFISVLAMVFFANEGGYSTYQKEGIIGFVCGAAIYWVLVLVIVAYIKSYRIKIYSKGWLRLHAVMTVLGGGIFCLIYSILIGGHFNTDIWLAWIFWPIFYSIWMLINGGVIINNKNVVSKIWLKRHYVIAWIISIVNMIYIYDGGSDSEVALFGGLTFILYYFLLFTTVWIMS